jgi:hypothetical protein
MKWILSIDGHLLNMQTVVRIYIYAEAGVHTLTGITDDGSALRLYQGDLRSCQHALRTSIVGFLNSNEVVLNLAKGES